MHAIAEAAIRGTIILLVAWGLAAVLRGARAAVRHLIWTAAAFSLLAVPVVSRFGPEWSVPVSTVTVPDSGGPVFQARNVPLADLPALALAQTAASRPAGPEPFRTANWPLTLWAFGAAVSALPWFLGVISIRWRLLGAKALTGEDWSGLVSQSLRALGIRRRVRVLLSSRTGMPMSAAVFRPVVVLPSQANDWPQERRRMVLLHELAHVQRRDCLTQSITRLACSLYWFHPLAWFAARQAVKERERACDDAVLQAGARASDYAGELLEMARSLTAPRLAWASVAMARPAQLEGRLLAILDGRARRGSVGRAAVLAAAAVSALAVVAVAAIRPVQAQVPALRAIPAAIRVPDNATQIPPAGDTEAARLTKQGDAAAAQGKADEAEAAYRKAAEAQKTAYGAESLEYGAAQLRLARYLRAHANFRAAASPFVTAVSIYERVYGPRTAEVADAYEYMGNQALQGGAYAKAAEHFQRAADLYKGVAGRASAPLAKLAALIGEVKMFEGNAQEAEAHFTRALDLNPAGADRALALELYSQLLKKLGRAAEAEKLDAEALAIRSSIVSASFAGTVPDPAFKVGGGVTPPVPVERPEPQYGETAWAAKHQGMAVYNVAIGPEGAILAASLKRAAGMGLDEMGAEALRKWKFQPATKEGRPVTVNATVEVNFRLM